MRIALEVRDHIWERIGWIAARNGVSKNATVRQLLADGTEDAKPPANAKNLEDSGQFTADELEKWEQIAVERGKHWPDLVRAVLARVIKEE